MQLRASISMLKGGSVIAWHFEDLESLGCEGYQRSASVMISTNSLPTKLIAVCSNLHDNKPVWIN